MMQQRASRLTWSWPVVRSLTSLTPGPNILVIARHGAIERAIGEIGHLWGSPFHIRILPGALNLPACQSGTLLIHDVAELTLFQQVAFADWLDARPKAVQVIALTAAPLGGLVRDGRFLEGLFHRLSTISIKVGMV
jgi:Sigma-54 interaction domain